MGWFDYQEQIQREHYIDDKDGSQNKSTTNDNESETEDIEAGTTTGNINQTEEEEESDDTTTARHERSNLLKMNPILVISYGLATIALGYGSFFFHASQCRERL